MGAERGDRRVWGGEKCYTRAECCTTPGAFCKAKPRKGHATALRPLSRNAENFTRVYGFKLGTNKLRFKNVKPTALAPHKQRDRYTPL